MDAATLAYYAQQAERLTAQYEALAPAQLPHLALVRTFFRVGESVADIGCGSGRDAAWLMEQGYAVTGFEGAVPMLAEAQRRHPQVRFEPATLPDLAEIPPDRQFQNLLCSAVLMHLPHEQLFTALMRLERLLLPHGRLVLTYRYSQTSDEREADGRLFTSIIPGKLELMLGAAGLRVLYATTEPDTARPQVRWQVVVAEKSPDKSNQGLDRLQGVLVQDKKDATYKLALLRALCDITDF